MHFGAAHGCRRNRGLIAGVTLRVTLRAANWVKLRIRYFVLWFRDSGGKGAVNIGQKVRFCRSSFMYNSASKTYRRRSLNGGVLGFREVLSACNNDDGALAHLDGTTWFPGLVVAGCGDAFSSILSNTSIGGISRESG